MNYLPLFRFYFRLLLICLGCLVHFPLRAELQLPNIFGSHMVLQRDHANPIWGRGIPGETVTVAIGEQCHSTKVTDQGEWRVVLEPLPVGHTYTLQVESEKQINYEDIMVGEVWVCSGQSNMQWPMQKTDQGNLYALAGNKPQIRLLSVPKNGTQEPQWNFEGAWEPASPESVADFSAVGYYFGLRLHETLGVPVGLIDNAWGGSAAEAWVPRDALEMAGTYDTLLENFDEKVAAYSDDLHDQKIREFREWERQGCPDPRVRWPRDPRNGNKRPANIFNGVLHPTTGYGIKGVIWYQGESNGSRGVQYQDLFPLLINTWRDLWGQGDFPFYWVQLADYKEEVAEPGDSNWAELREAQTMTLNLPNTGQVVAIDLGEGRDIHPRDKLSVGNRLARIALARDYGFEIDYQNPQIDTFEIKGDGVLLTFKHVSNGGLRSFDQREIKGFSTAGKDQVFHWANAKMVGKNQILVSSPDVPNPVSVRYGWAINPVVNLFDRNGLPVTPFRTDDWPLTSEGKTY